MKVRFIKPYYLTEVGAVVVLDNPVAELLVGRNIAERVIGTQLMAADVNECGDKLRQQKHKRKAKGV